MAQMAQVPAQYVAPLAIAFVVCRVLHGVFYLAAIAALRSLVWLGGYACVVALMVLAALRVGG